MKTIVNLFRRPKTNQGGEAFCLDCEGHYSESDPGKNMGAVYTLQVMGTQMLCHLLIQNTQVSEL